MNFTNFEWDMNLKKKKKKDHKELGMNLSQHSYKFSCLEINFKNVYFSKLYVFCVNLFMHS